MFDDIGKLNLNLLIIYSILCVYMFGVRVCVGAIVIPQGNIISNGRTSFSN